MKEIQHPACGLSGEAVAVIRKHAAGAEMAGQLLPEQLKLIHQQRWFHLFVPKTFGGLELSLPEAVRLEESLAWADGSLGWVVTLCSGATMFIGYFDEALVKEVYSDPMVCLAGSGQVNGRARLLEDGFDITGSWPYASGAPHATHFTANCTIEKNGKTLLHPDGSRVIQSFLFTKQEVSLHANWQYIGLNATAGYSFSVNGLKVPANRTFIINAERAYLPQAVYRYPFLQLAEATLAVNTSGMCLYFLEIAREQLTAKQATNPRVESIKTKGLQLVAEALHDMQLLRERFYGALDRSWQKQVTHHTVPDNDLKAVSCASHALAQQARAWVDRIYPYCGMHAARTDCPINQVWRNIHTASQHLLLLDVQ